MSLCNSVNRPFRIYSVLCFMLTIAACAQGPLKQNANETAKAGGPNYVEDASPSRTRSIIVESPGTNTAANPAEKSMSQAAENSSNNAVSQIKPPSNSVSSKVAEKLQEATRTETADLVEQKILIDQDSERSNLSNQGESGAQNKSQEMVLASVMPPVVKPSSDNEATTKMTQAENVRNEEKSGNANTMTISGSAQLLGREARTANISDGVAYFIPDDKSLLAVKPGRFAMDMVRKQFSPRVIPAPVGSEITIPNGDNILHNAFSPSTDNRFDTGLYGKDELKSFTLNSPGVVRIYCNVHFNMVGYVLSLETPYFTQLDTNGDFMLNDLPAVPGKLVIWHERTREFTQPISPDLENRVTAAMRITRRRIPQHSNKFGESYRKRRD